MLVFLGQGQNGKVERDVSMDTVMLTSYVDTPFDHPSKTIYTNITADRLFLYSNKCRYYTYKGSIKKKYRVMYSDG
jgi:hypothetical protein